MEFYIAINGCDTNPGTQDAPFATLSSARDAVRTLIAKGLTEALRPLL